MSSPVWRRRNRRKSDKFYFRRISQEFGVPWPPVIGQIVCDCRYQHRRVASINVEWDDVYLDDGYGCSLFHCLWPVPHDGMNHD